VEAVADVSEKETTVRLGVEECLVLGDRELEVAIDVACVAESQMQDLLLHVVSD
jgi:hypothetical protein